jgi:hypothetical protein
MAEKRTAKSTTADPASSPASKARAGAEPEPAPAKAAKATKRTKAAAPAETTKAAKATKQAAKAPAKKAAKAPVKKAPARKAAAAPATQAAAPAPVAVPGAWTAAVREALSQPGQPPQRLAELAVAELGPRAAAWARWLRDTYPDPPAHGIARLAAHEARQLGRALALATAGGPVAAALSLPAIVWVRAALVLRIAAAYGHDPADPQRAADLLTLLDLGTGQGRRRLLGLAATRIGARVTPAFVAFRMLVSVGDDQFDRLAGRAARFYRQGSQDRTSASSASTSSPNRP